MSETEDPGPAWKLIADALRSDVGDEVYPPGSPLPGENQLAERHGVSRPTVRRAINVLVGEGLLTASHGRGTFVRVRPDRRVILINSADPIDLLAEEHDPLTRGWQPGEGARYADEQSRGFDLSSGVVTAIGRGEAEALGVRTLTPGFCRYQVWRLRPTYQAIAVQSVIPSHLLGIFSEPEPEEPAGLDERMEAGTADPVRTGEDDDQYAPDDGELETPEEPADGEGEGGAESDYARLARQRGPVRFVTTVTARMPIGDEVGDLDVATGTAVLEIRRVMTDTNGNPLELTTITAPADRFEVANAPEWLAATRSTGGDAAAVLRL